MPIQSYQAFRRIIKLCQADVPQALLDQLDPIQTDDQAVKDFGVALAIDMIKQLRENGVNGFHFCTLNLEKSVKRVLYGLEWAEEPGTPSSVRPPHLFASYRLI